MKNDQREEYISLPTHYFLGHQLEGKMWHLLILKLCRIVGFLFGISSLISLTGQNKQVLWGKQVKKVSSKFVLTKFCFGDVINYVPYHLLIFKLSLIENGWSLFPFTFNYAPNMYKLANTVSRKKENILQSLFQVCINEWIALGYTVKVSTLRWMK